MTMTCRRAIAGVLVAPMVLRHACAATVIRMGTLKLIHAVTPCFYDRVLPAGTTVGIIPFESRQEAA